MKKNYLALSLLAAATLMVTACGGDDNKGAVATAQAATTNSAATISEQSSKNYLALSLLAAATLMVTACGGDDNKGAVATAQAATTNSAATISEQSSFEDKSSYAVGASVGTYIAQIESDQQDVLGKFNHDLVVKGFLDALEDKVALDDKVMQETLLALDTKLREGIEQKQKEVQPRFSS